MNFYNMSLEELSRDLRDRGCSKISPAELDGYNQQYGAFYAGLLGQILALLGTVERGALIPAEAVALGKALFAQYMHEYVPACRVAVTRYQAKMAKIELEKTNLMVAQQEARQARERSAAAQQQEAEARKAQDYRDRLAADASAAAELQIIRAKENETLIQGE